MNITQITSLAGSRKRRRRVGRGPGSGRGKTSGRGHKGAGQRAGAQRGGLREGGQMPVFRRIPKRGFSNARFTTRHTVVNVASLQDRCTDGMHVTPQVMLETGLIRSVRDPIKVLGNGELNKKLTVDAAKFSRSAVRKIEAAGGVARVLGRTGKGQPRRVGGAVPESASAER